MKRPEQPLSVDKDKDISTTTSMESPTQQSPFLRLPVELRLIIYDYIFTDIAIAVRNRITCQGECYQSYRIKCPAMLRACRQIRAESSPSCLQYLHAWSMELEEEASRARDNLKALEDNFTTPTASFNYYTVGNPATFKAGLKAVKERKARIDDIRRRAACVSMAHESLELFLPMERGTVR
ncbi:hypothetical protein LTR37_014670 [Vermiconidia calcicola]|uniref:Uncharacterized protein n=1 Tax=Vermiconidia calcicola TaxID=1690605 RepID=A0ACC3MSW4_9PEZI|nr:hypothetical protein LTR37_014670 [Vermiconidia calcicola]